MLNRPIPPRPSYPAWLRPTHAVAVPPVPPLPAPAAAALSVRVWRLVYAPGITERITDLTHGCPSPERLPERVEQVRSPIRGVPDVIDPALEFGAVAAGPQLRQALGLLLLDGRVDAQRLIVLIVSMGEPVDADDHARPRVDLARDVIGRPLDLCLLEAALDRGDRAAQFFDSGQQLAGRLLDVAGHRLHRVRPGERINGRGQIGLESEHLLGAQGKPRRLLGWQRDRLVVGVRVQRLGAAKHGG